MKLYLFISFLLIACPGYSQQTLVHFNPGSYQVTDADITALKLVVEKYNHCQNTINIQGYADSIGSEELNQRLSQKRAEAVIEALYKLGLKDIDLPDAPAVEIKSFGKRDPIADNKTKNGRQLNRRVEIHISSQLCEKHVEDSSSIEALYDILKDKGEEFCINPLRDTALTGKKGTIVYYKAGSFENTADCSCITIILNEYYEKSSLILNNLTTTSNEVALESGGMTKLTGLCGKDTLRFRPGKFLIVMTPTDTLLPGMKLFSANREKQSDYLDWQLDKDNTEIEGGDWNNFLRCCISKKSFAPQKCPLFFCRIKRFLFSNKKEKNVDKINDLMRAEDELIKKYGLDEKQLEHALLLSKKANNEVLKYYVYKNANWDYHNIDRFKYGGEFTNLRVDEQVQQSKDVKLVYQESKTVLPATGKTTYIFRNVFADKNVWIVGLKSRDQQSAFLSLKNENSSSKTVKLDFKIVEIEELKRVLQKLNQTR